MNSRVILYILGHILLLGSLVLLLPLGYALWLGEAGLFSFGPAFLLSLTLGVLGTYGGRRHKRQFSAVTGAWYMFLLWLVLGLLGMLPYLLSGVLTSPVDAFFESVSAVTTTGTSLLVQQEIPLSLRFWHSLLAWFGGLNYILLLVSIMPEVNGCFGLTLSVHQSVIFSPMVGRMQEAARQTGKIYLVLTAFSFLLYLVAGLTPMAALNQALLTISTCGGAAFVPLNTPALEFVAGISLLLASGNFLLYWKGWERRDLKSVFQDTEMHTFLLIFFSVGLLVSLHLATHTAYSILESFRYGFFAVLSFISTTGFLSVDTAAWPAFDKYLLFLLAFVGGCIGSATGGFRVMRFLVLFKMAAQEMRRTLHPRMVIAVQLDHLSVPLKIISRVLSYFFLFVSTFLFSLLIFSLTGVSPLQAMGLSLGCLSSIGATLPLLGLYDVNFLPAWSKLYCSLLMILGRIEIFSLFIVIETAIHRLRRHRW